MIQPAALLQVQVVAEAMVNVVTYLTPEILPAQVKAPSMPVPTSVSHGGIVTELPDGTGFVQMVPVE
jgi:hypothetical protein